MINSSSIKTKKNFRFRSQNVIENNASKDENKFFPFVSKSRENSLQLIMDQSVKGMEKPLGLLCFIIKLINLLKCTFFVLNINEHFSY